MPVMLARKRECGMDGKTVTDEVALDRESNEAKSFCEYKS